MSERDPINEDLEAAVWAMAEALEALAIVLYRGQKALGSADALAAWGALDEPVRQDLRQEAVEYVGTIDVATVNRLVEKYRRGPG